jgi:hypothetical protein
MDKEFKPYHTRIAFRGSYGNLIIVGPVDGKKGTKLDDWLTSEYERGYTLHTIAGVGIPDGEDGRESVCVVTQHRSVR